MTTMVEQDSREAGSRILIATSDVRRSDSDQVTRTRDKESLLASRAEDIEQAIAELAAIIASSRVTSSSGLDEGARVSQIEATFGLTLDVEAGILISKVSSAASFEVKITVELSD